MLRSRTARPIRKPKAAQLTAPARDFNQHVSSQRACAERAVAHLKNWRILATGYRRLLADLLATLSVITKLEIYRTSTPIS
jgi:hypothetical protein